MKISTKTRYALRILLQLALHEDREMSLRELSETEEVSEKYLSLIVIPLRRAGLIKAIKGKYGGYKLAISPDDISLKCITDALETQDVLVNCQKQYGLCKRSEKCLTKNLWQDLTNKINDLFGSITLTSILNKGGVEYVSNNR